MSRVLVTGGTGFVGRRAVPLLVARGHDVIGLARSDAAAAKLANMGADSVRGDLDDLESMIDAFRAARADALANIASLGFGHGPDIVRAAAEAGLQRCVFISTTAIFTKLNAQTKSVRIAAEQAIVESSLDWTILRPTMIYGAPDDRNLADLLKALRRIPVMPLVGGGARLQQPVHVDDVATAIADVLDHPTTVNRAYDIGGPRALPFEEMIDDVAQALSRDIVKVRVPLAPLVAAASLYERFSTTPRFRAEQFERLAEDKSFDITAASRDFAFTPLSFEDGIRAEAELLFPDRSGSGRVSAVRQFSRYLRTVRHVPPNQLRSRVRLRALRQALKRWPSFLESRWTLRPSTATPGWPSGFRPLDADRHASAERAAEIERDEFVFLNRRSTVRGDWEKIALPQLWRFSLHYWDWCWHLVGHRSRHELTAIVERLYDDWSASTVYGRLDAWSPYVASLRLWTWCGLHGNLDGGSALAAALGSEIGRHAGFLRVNLETDVGGNHLIKNLKALVGAAIFLGDEPLLADSLNRLDRQISIQVLDDGGHYELSPSYHAQVLGDLLDVSELLAANGRSPTVPLERAIPSMRRWLADLLGPDGEVPVFNDGHAVEAAELRRLGVPAPSSDRLTEFGSSGYIVCRPRPDVQLVIDVGHPGPAELPAHAHADCLSYELVIGADRVVVDAGTSQYGATARRAFERSTAAHNTVEIDRTDQTEVWGAFRAGRRARPAIIEVADRGEMIVVEAEHDGYRSLSGRPVHRRRFEISADAMTVTDTVVGSDVHEVVSRLRLTGAAERTGSPDGGADVATGATRLRVTGDRPLEIDEAQSHAREFGRLRPATVLAMSADAALPTEIRWRLEWS